ncbi:MAG: metallophosphoesterase [Patescibacteria group bacterium]|nr:metallophosphoesterase [Patescibacteria group bacterium]
MNYYLHIQVSTNTVSVAIFAIASILVVYGVWNAFNIKIINKEIKSNSLKKNWVDKKIVLISDTHLGHMQRSRFSKKMIQLIKKENPDIVLHVGDIIDGPIFNYEKSFKYFETLNPPLGFFYVEGNHERYSQDYDSFRKAFPKNIVDMTNSIKIINDTQIIGASFNQNESAEEIKNRIKDLGYDTNIPSILLLHYPKNNISLADLGISLIASGHTHDGQFFPFNLILKSIYKSQSYGVTYTKENVAITTSGTGMTFIPMRIGTHSEIVVLKII